MKKNTYPTNFYVQHHDEIIEISKNGGEVCVIPTDICLDKMDVKYGLEKNDLLRAQYYDHFNLTMSKSYKKLLEESVKEA